MMKRHGREDFIKPRPSNSEEETLTCSMVFALGR